MTSSATVARAIASNCRPAAAWARPRSTFVGGSGNDVFEALVPWTRNLDFEAGGGDDRMQVYAQSQFYFRAGRGRGVYGAGNDQMIAGTSHAGGQTSISDDQVVELPHGTSLQR